MMVQGKQQAIPPGHVGRSGRRLDLQPFVIQDMEYQLHESLVGIGHMRQHFRAHEHHSMDFSSPIDADGEWRPTRDLFRKCANDRTLSPEEIGR